MIDRFKDNYEEPNYTRLFLLFVLFLVSLYFWLGGAAENYVGASVEGNSSSTRIYVDGLPSNDNNQE